MMPHLGRPRERLSTGLRWGFVYAAACSAVALTSVLIRGPAVLKPYHVGVLGMIALYFGSGLVGGSVFGLLMPLGQTLGGAALLGWLVMVPVAVLMSIVVAPDVRPGSAEFVWMCAAVSLLGPACGAAFWIRRTSRR
jgi:hypothetical protein